MTTAQKERYEYFYNGVWPIRATRGQSGTVVATETPYTETGDLIMDPYWSTKVNWDMSGDFDVINKEEFDKLCTEIYKQEEGETKYFLRDKTPIKAKLHPKSGRIIDIIKLWNDGTIVRDRFLISEIKDGNVQEISREEFDRRYVQIFSGLEKKTDPDVPNPGV